VNYEIINLLDSNLGICKQFGKGERYYYCPFCSHYNPKFAINVIKGFWQCWKCGEKGRSLVKLLYKLRASAEDITEMRRLLNDQVIIPDTEPPTQLTLPPEYRPMWERSHTLSYHQALNYILSRNINRDDIFRYQLGYCAEGRYAHRIIVPSHDESGALNFFVARDYTGKAYVNYLNPPVSKNIIGFDYHLNWNYPLVLVEGMFDAIATKRNATPLIGKYLSKKLQQKIIETGVKDIYVAFDQDAFTETLKISEKFMKNGVGVYVVELSGKDPSIIGFSEMNKLIKNSHKLGYMDLMKLKLRMM
jgi:ribosomal protein L37AE/L43A